MPSTPIMIDPALFHADAIAPETQAINAQIEALLKDAPTVADLGAPKVRALRASGQGLLADQPPHPMARWETATASDGTDASVPVRIFEPDGPVRGVYLHIHGGGGVLGSAGAQDQHLAQLATRLEVGVVSVEYRLAPEHRWPSSADDCLTAALWLVAQAPTLFGTDRLLIGGESGGAHLAAVTLLRTRDRLGHSPFCGANLIYGMYDMAGTPSVHGWGPRKLVLSTPIIEWFGLQVLPQEMRAGMALRTPDFSPLYGDLSGLCPALFTVGTLDPLIDDSILMATKWAAAANVAELAIYPGGIHAFDMIPDLPIATTSHERVYSFLQAQLA